MANPPGINIFCDVSEIYATAQNFRVLPRQLPMIVGRAMTMGAKASREKIRAGIFPLIQGGPTQWTKRGLIVKYATPVDLRIQVGFNYGEGKFEDTEFTPKGFGIPSGRYMGINARGGPRRPKSTELQLRRSGAIPGNKFLTPNKNMLEIDKHGNLPGYLYTQISSRVRGLHTPGSTQNAPYGPGSRGRTAKKRAQADYFVMRYAGGYPAGPRELGAEPAFIAKREGLGRGKKRGFSVALWIVDQPMYKPRFPIQRIALAEFERVFGIEFGKGVASSRAWLARRGITP
jgi:hypothetical protein